jgi:chromosome segregation ATPase
MSDLLKETLSSYTPRPGGSSQTVEVTIDQLEWMAAKISRLEDDLQSRNEVDERLREIIKRNESQIKSYQKTIKTLQPKWMQAVSDRGVYELETKAAVQRAAKLEEELEKSRAETRALAEKLAAQTPADLEEAQAKRDSLEKKLKNTTNDLDYLRSRYQAASSSAAELASENTDLKAQIKHLEQKSSDATIRLHEINHKNMVEDQQRRIDDLQAIISQREQQLDRAETELRALKNGRRETRASSVPRSPRLNVMSPRTRGGGGGNGGNTSRGTSPAPFDGSSTPSSAAGPVPGMTFYQPPGSHPRFSHLRE